MMSQVKSLTTAIARLDLILMGIESVILYLVIEKIGNLTAIFFMGRGSIAVTLSYFFLLVFFFSTPIYRSPFILLSGFEHYSKVAIDILKVFTLLAFEFFILNLQAGRSFFLFALPFSLFLRLVSRKTLKVIFGLRVRETPVYIFSNKDFVETYLEGYFKNIKVLPEDSFGTISKNLSTYANSLVLLHNNRDFSREHDRNAAYLVSEGIILGYLDSYTRMRGRIGLRIVLGALIILIRQPVQSNRTMLLSKRIADIVISGFLLIILFTILPFFYLFYKTKNGSPLIFKQSRVGLAGKPFLLYKIRTVAGKGLSVTGKIDQEVMWVPKPTDDVLLPWGKFLRRWSLDEAPQLFNVLKGDMSIVGPRPRLENEENQSNYRMRLSVKPGLTGLWQISGRNLISPQDAEELDDYYIDHWSFLVDIQICAKTITVIRNGLGAR